MIRPVELPEVFEEIEQIGGVLRVACFETDDGASESARSAIALTLPDINSTVLASIQGGQVDEARFFGQWHRADIGKVIRTNTNAAIEDSGGAAFDFGSAPLKGGDGEFAYALAFPPYPLFATGQEIQTLFDKVRAALLDSRHPTVIEDWTCPQLPEVSPYFEAGAEWWGMFMWTLWTPSLSRLTVIAASASD